MGVWIGQSYLPISLEVDRTAADDPPTYEQRRRKPYVPAEGPCAGCELAEQCASERLACQAFYKFTYSGRVLPPSEPSSEVYQRVFGGDDLEPQPERETDYTGGP